MGCFFFCLLETNEKTEITYTQHVLQHTTYSSRVSGLLAHATIAAVRVGDDSTPIATVDTPSGT